MRAPSKLTHRNVFRKWVTLVNGTTLYVKTDKVPNAAFRALKAAGLCLGGKLERKAEEPDEMRALLIKMGAKKMTAKERKRFRTHLEN